MKIKTLRPFTVTAEQEQIWFLLFDIFETALYAAKYFHEIEILNE